MPVQLSTLPDDALALVAEQVVRNGEAYWLAATWRGGRRAVRTACVALGIEKPTSRTSAVFGSLVRLRAALKLAEPVRILLADRRVPGAHALPSSLDGMLVWTPAAKRAMVKGATVDVMDYAWANWRAAHRFSELASVEAVCLGNRPDLLDVMYAHNTLGQGGSHLTSLQSLLRLALQGHPDSIKRILESVVQPAIRGCAYRTAEWLYAKLEELSQSMDATCEWRCWLSHLPLANTAARAATRSETPDRALRMLTDWWMPRYGSRAPSERLAAVQHIVLWVLTTVTSSTQQAFWTTKSTVLMWKWLASAWPMGLAHLLRELHEEGAPIVSDAPTPSVAYLHRNCLRVRDVDTYRWMRDNLAGGGWMIDAITCSGSMHIVTWTVDKELARLQQTASAGHPAFALANHVYLATIAKVRPYVTHNERKKAQLEVGTHRELLIEAYTDWLLLRPEWKPLDDVRDYCQVHPTPTLLEYSKTAFVESLRRFSKRASPEQRRVALDALMPGILNQLLQEEQPEGGSPSHYIDSEDEEERSAAWQYISSLRHEYSKWDKQLKQWRGWK